MAVLQPHTQVVRRLLCFFALLSLGASSLLAQLGGNPGVNICQASAAPAMVRGEGIAELAADIVVTCINGTAPGTPVTASEVLMNVFVRTNVDITNNVDFGAGAAITDAVLVVNENNCPSPSASGGVFGGCGASSPVYQKPQFGARAAADRLQWLSVRVPVPGGPGPNGPHPSTTTIRITAIRVRASQPGVPHAASIPSSPFTATVTLAASGFSIGANNVVGVALPILGLVTSLPGDSAGELCRAGAATVPMILRENFAAALRVAGPPSFFPEQSRTESGYFGNAHPGRILVRFSNIPPGARLTLPKLIETGNPSVNADALRLQWVQGAAANGTAGTVSSQTDSLIFDSPPGGLAFAVYQVIDANPSTLESAPVPVGVSWAAGAPAGVIQVSAYPAPLSTVTAASLAAPEPRFLDAASPRALFAITPCRSTLLFPYISNGAGESTRLILDNASGDVSQTVAHSGACTLRYRGVNAPSDQTTAVIGSGGQLDIALATAAPGFNGHILAQCEFEGGLGKAILSRGATVFYESEAELIAVNGSPTPPEPLPLLFAHVAGSPGFDTRIAIINPTLDLPGVTGQSGACSIHYFGQNAPASQLTTPIPPGGRLAFALSTGAASMGVPAAPNFSGYIAANCEFPYARGFAAITEHQNPALPPGASPAIAGYGVAAESFRVPVIAFPEEEPPPSTELLIPYVSARGGHETLLSISNVSLDGIGTPPQAGACTLEYHRDGSSPAPAPQIFALAAGEQTVFRLSVGDPVHAIAPAPGFSGYLTLFCNFRRARAVALVRSPAAGSPNAAFAHPAEALTLPRNVAPEPLLRSYVSNRPGEDRVIVFANTSRDPFGSTPAGGVCSLSFRGPGSPAPSGLLLSAGTVRAFLLSRGLPALGVPAAPGFQGFLLGLCDVGLVRALDYRINPQPGLAPFCQVDSNPGFQPSDVVTLTAMLGQIVPIGHPGDPDGDSSITTADVQYCNNLAVATQPDPEPEPNPDADPGPGPKPDPFPNPDPAPGGPSTGADLRIAFEASPAIARPQRSLKLRALISNAGSAAAENVAVVVHLPAAFVLSSGPDACTGDDQARTCNLGVLSAGQAVSLQFSGAVSAAASAELTAYAQLSSSSLDLNPANNAVDHVVPLESQADIAASAYLLPRFPAPGQTATLTVSVTNRGPAFANAVSLQALLGPSVQLHRIPAGCSLAGRELQCGIGALPAGRTRAYLLPVRISAGGGAQGGGQGSFVSTVTGSASTSEYKPENNAFTLMTVSTP